MLRAEDILMVQQRALKEPVGFVIYIELGGRSIKRRKLSVAVVLRMIRSNHGQWLVIPHVIKGPFSSLPLTRGVGRQYCEYSSMC